MLVKVCGLIDEGNVKEILADLSPDFLGMIFYDKSQRYIGTEPFSTEKEIPKVGVFVNAEIDHIIKKKKLFEFGWVQLHGDEDIAFITDLKEQIDIKVIKVFRVTDRIDLEVLKLFEPLVDYFLFDTQTVQYGGSGIQFNWAILKDYNLETPFILSGGIDLEHAQAVLSIYKENPKMAGVDINSKFETEPGIKDPEKVAKFIKLIRDNTINRISYDRNR